MSIYVNAAQPAVNGNGNGADTSIATGAELERFARKAKPRVRTEVAGLLVRRLTVARLTPAQAGKLTRTSTRRVNEWLGREPRKYRRSDAALDRLVERIGAERLMAALDRATRPRT